jgi:hypothetical protein
MTVFDANSLLAAGPNGPAGPNGNFLLGVKILIFVAATLLLSILRRIAEAREKAIRANNPPKTPTSPQAPATPKKDNPFRNEIEAFLEEVGKRRAAGERLGRPVVDRSTGEPGIPKTPPTPKLEPTRKPVVLRPVGTSDRNRPEPPKTVVIAPGLARPGEEIAARRAPGSENLGKQIRTHVAQYLDASRMTTQTQSDLGNSVDRAVRQHLGERNAGGVAELAQTPTSAGANLIVPLLRNQRNVRTAIVINEILGPPKGLRRRR